MQLVDSHCHIQSINADKANHTVDLWQSANLTVDEVIARANEAGVIKFICVGCDLDDSYEALSLASSHDNCFASIGIHPHEADHYIDLKHTSEQFKHLIEADKQHKIVAIGECGLDYFYQYSSAANQKEVLKLQLELAKSYNLPLIFHVRQAFDDFWPIFDDYSGQVKGVIHSYTDNKVNLDKALERKLFIGVNGIATFIKQADQLEVIKAIPTANLLLETDAPYLTPVPYRGNINEPKHVKTILEFLAKLKSEEVEYIANTTTFNANLLFGL